MTEEEIRRTLDIVLIWTYGVVVGVVLTLLFTGYLGG